jgi:hypothetical protein
VPFPSFEEYTDTLRLPLGDVLSDPLLAYGEIRKGSSGQPVACSGNFALTFQVTSGGRKYALRCFHKEADALLLRYKAIVKKLRSIRSPHFMYFDFQPLGIKTESGSYPIVRMDWAEGETLARFVASNRGDPVVLRQLRNALRALAAHLVENGIAHGDIQPGNVIVRNANAIRLIDYDGMFVPELAPLISNELGQRNFQHPGRTSLHFDQRMDVFSFCVLDLTLDALSRRPELWDETGSDEQAFILRASDYADPGASRALGLICEVPDLAPRARHLAAICASSYESMPSFEDFLAGRNIPSTPVTPAADPERLPRPAYTAAFSVINAADFAQCCARIGDRVELIGQIVRIRRLDDGYGRTRLVRIEFGEFPQDLVCVTVPETGWNGAASTPDESWAGQWVSVIGLVNPVGTDDRCGTRLKYVAIELEDSFQLQLLRDADARYRLGVREAARISERPPVDGAVGTDPVEPRRLAPLEAVEAIAEGDDNALATGPTETRAPQQPRASRPGTVSAGPAASGLAGVVPVVVARDIPTAPGRDRVRQGRPGEPRAIPAEQGRHRAAWAFGGIALAALAITAWFAAAPRKPLPHDQGAGAVPAASAVVPSGSNERPDSPDGPAAVVSSHTPAVVLSARDLRKVVPPIQSIGGTVGVVEDPADPAEKVLTVDGALVPGVKGNLVELAHEVRFTNRDVVLGYTDCVEAGAPCRRRRPFWIVLRGDAPVRVVRSNEIWSASAEGEISALDSGIHVPLGVWDGVHRIQTLTARDDLYITRSIPPARPLDRDDCREVSRALESCSRSSDCGTFASSMERIPPGRLRTLNRMFHETTGFNAPAFVEFCMTSCRLALTPSYSFTRKRVCSGSEPGQWTAPAAQIPGEQASP